MTTIRLGAAVNVREFQDLLNSLTLHEGHTLDHEALQDEFGRFRVWSGNLGVLQKGHSSLDYRLRDAPLLSNEVSKLLKELEENLHAAHDIVTGVRLPYEQQSHTVGSEEDDDDDSFFSEGEDDESDLGAPKTELAMRFQEVVDIIDNLYKISVRIRAPTVRTRSLKAASYQPKDPDTGVNILDQYAIYDKHHTHELVRHLRMPHGSPSESTEESDELVNRLARAITLRRRQFKYWRRHRDKLGISTIQEEPHAPAAVQRPEAPHRHDTLEAQPGTPGIDVLPKLAPSQKTGKTLLSGTEATHHHQSLDDIVDSKSVTSYAVTVKDLSGKGIDLPPPPKAVDGDRDFECPYCFIICPARYGKGRPWRTHVLQDLQPYVCTYSECQTSDQLFRSRRDWIEHESSHRKAWRCPEHPDAVYKSHTGLVEHFRNRHGDSIPESQIPSIVKVGETSTIDLRQKCPICYASVDMEGMGTLQNHIANHLERIAAFSLPIDVEDESDGGSSRASRGGSESSAIPTASRSSEDSDYSGYSGEQKAEIDSLPSAGAMVSSTTSDQLLRQTTTESGLLSESLIRALPDDSGQRLSLLFSSHEGENDISDDNDDVDDVDEDEGSFDENEIAIEEHMAEREAFRGYLLSLPGAQSVRFYKRYGSWNGNIDFRDGDFAVRAMQSFDKERYPKVRLRQKGAKKETLKFSVLQLQQTKQVSFRSDPVAIQGSPSYSVSSGSEQPSTHKDAGELSPILAIADIQNLRSLYRSGELLVRDDPSYVPNNRYNEIISYCYYDITRLKVDAIVNSSNRELAPSRAEWTLNSIIHKAAGPGLREECSRLNKLRVSQSVLTGGYQLPCDHIIHVARPHYASSKGMGQYNLLTEGYRSALRLAMKQNLKTVAFCCLGTGGVGFPARIAARVALQEAREFLDAHPRHAFERIVFCVYSEDDMLAYTDFFPDFFPPTQEDLEMVASTAGTRNVAKLSALIQEVYAQVDSVTQQVKKFNVEATNMPQRVAQELSVIAVLLESFKELVTEDESERLLSRMMRHIELLCSVMLAICGNMTEMVELAKAKENLGTPSHKLIWDDYNNHMHTYQGLTIVQLIDICKEFAQHLNDVLEQNIAVPHEMKTIGIRLGAWLTKQTGDGPQSTRDHFEEVMLTREYQRDTLAPNRANTVKLYQVPNLAQLYEQGTLQPRNTSATPSIRANNIVCLSRDDITRLEVDILVSSTDAHFSGMGRLDRTVFLGGGRELEEECASHAPCTEGEVVLTGGYALPAKHVLHAIPPAIYRTDTLDVLRDIYRKIFQMASYLRATSIAIPSIGTGMLNYPRGESATVAITEVKRFLESLDESNTIEKIVLVAFSLNDGFAYESLLPAYFPQPNSSTEVTRAIPIPSSPKSSPGRTRTLFGTLGEAFRKLAPGKQPASTTRPLEPSEEDVLIAFETHAQGCPTCSNISKIYSEGKDLCDDGYRLASQVLRHLHMKMDQSVHSLRSVEDVPREVEIPDIFPLSLELLHTVEQSFRDLDRDRPFVSNQPSLGSRRRIPEYTVYNIEVTVSSPPHFQQAFDRIHIWSDPSTGWQTFEAPIPTLHLTRGALLIRQGGYDSISKPPTRLNLSPRSTLHVQSGTKIVVNDVNADQDFANELGNRFTLELQSQSNCEMLLTRLKHAADNSPTLESRGESQLGITNQDAEASNVPQNQPKKAFAQVFLWEQATESWEPFDAEQSEALLYVRPGSLEVLQRASKFTWRLKLTSYSIIKEQSSVEILIERVTTAGDSDTELGRWKRILLKCRSQTERDNLLASLQHAADSSGRPPTPSQPTSRARYNFRDDLKGLDQHWKDQDQLLSGQPQFDVPTEVGLPSVLTKDPMNIGSATGDMRAANPQHRQEGSDTVSASATGAGTDNAARSDLRFPGFLEHRVLTYIESLPRDRNATVHEQELVVELGESSANLKDAIEHLRSLNLITAVPDREHTWTMSQSPTILPRTAQPGSNTTPEASTQSQEPKSADSKPNPSPKLLQRDIAEDLLPGTSAARAVGPIAPTDASQPSVQTPPEPSASSASRDPLARLIDPKLLPLEELNIGNYFEHEMRFTKAPFTQVDKRLVYKSVLEKAGLDFRETDAWYLVFKVLGEEELLRLHQETRNTPRFTP